MTAPSCSEDGGGQVGLEKEQTRADGSMLGAILAVVMGLLIETIPEFLGSENILQLGHKVGAVFVTIGVMAELAIEFWSIRIHTQLLLDFFHGATVPNR
jgi:uncharacterized transporter YbjL